MTKFQSLSQEDSLEEEVGTHSSILAWRIPWTEQPGELWSIDHKEYDRTKVTEHTRTHKGLLTDSIRIQTLILWGHHTRQPLKNEEELE